MNVGGPHDEETEYRATRTFRVQNGTRYLMAQDKYIIPESFTALQSIQLLHFVTQAKYQNYKESCRVYVAQNRPLDELFLTTCYKSLQNLIQYLKNAIKVIQSVFHIKDIFENLASSDIVTDLRILRFDMVEEFNNLKEKLGKNDFSSIFKRKKSGTNDDERAFESANNQNKVPYFSGSSPLSPIGSSPGTPSTEREFVESLKYKKLLNLRQQEMQLHTLEQEKIEHLKLQIRKEIKKELQAERLLEKPQVKRADKGYRDNLDRRLSQINTSKKPSKSAPEISTGLNAAILAFNGTKPKHVAPTPSLSSFPTSNTTSNNMRKPSPNASKRKSVHLTAPATTHRARSESPVLLTDKDDVFVRKDSKREKPLDPRLKDLPLDRTFIDQIMNEILVSDKAIRWDDICGLEQTKSVLKETVVYPLLRPDIFKGLREPVTGILLFGPPGTGKTMIGKCVASECNATFFSISSSTLLSKFLGESEKLIKALFLVAKRLAPSIIFIDEIDSLLSSRSGDAGENESSRRVKTELLIQWSNISNDQVLVLGATNLPWSIDEAARRRFSKKLYIPLPDYQTRALQLRKLLCSALTDKDFHVITNLTDGYSSSDLMTLCKEAAMHPVRELGEELLSIDLNKVRSIGIKDVLESLEVVKPSVSKQNLKNFETWATQFGSTG